MSRLEYIRPRRSRRNERGSVTSLGLGLTLILFIVGGISIDLWRVIAARQELVQQADAAATAGADAIDINEFRTSGNLVLDPAKAVAFAEASLGQPSTWDFSGTGVVVDDDGDGLADDMVITLTQDVDFALLGILSDTKTVAITVRSVASPESG